MKEMGKKEYIPWTPEEGFDLSFLSEYNVSESELKKKGWRVMAWWEREENEKGMDKEKEVR